MNEESIADRGLRPNAEREEHEEEKQRGQKLMHAFGLLAVVVYVAERSQVLNPN